MPETPAPSDPSNEPAVTRTAGPTAVGDTLSPVLQTSSPSSMPVIQIEGYRILNEIARGGQAIVFCALNLKIGRKVAIKVMREGPLATENGRLRFTREAQILASLNHPNIVTILDRGTTADGSEYFTMDYIEGLALDEGTWKLARFAEKAKSDPAISLQLFLKICDAVNAAHLRGIVHRDLKPSNIRLDERGEPHVLDFGLARGSLGEELTGSGEPVTITGQFLGSLPWASPEQAEGVGQKIDMRSDVYSLGVILYQLMTGGSFPYQVAGSMRDVLNNIITAEPPAPSQVLSQRESRDAARRIKRVGKEVKFLNAALDAIILKALAKQRDNRYQTAGELARDIEAYLAGRPLKAGDAKPVKSRNWLPVGISVGVALGLLVWAGVSLMRTGSTQAPAIGPTNPTESKPTIATGSLPAMVANSPLKQEYQDLETIMNRFMPIVPYFQSNGASRFAIWREASDKGDAVGQLLLSRCYENGAGVARNPETAQRLLQSSADQKLPMALCLLGIRYRASNPPIQDFAEALKWYELAADAGSARAMIDLGIMHNRGMGAPADNQKAMRWYQQAADLGAPAAYSMMGEIYRTPGNGMTDLPRAAELFKRAINVGAPSAYLSLGLMYTNGNGVPQDFSEAMKLFQRADVEGVPAAGEVIGDLYLAGKGVNQDFAQAAKWYQKSAEMNVASAMRKLASLYESGNGVPQDLELATNWYTRAANTGDAQAKKWLETGEVGK